METPSTARTESCPDLYIFKRFLIDIIAGIRKSGFRREWRQVNGSFYHSLTVLQMDFAVRIGGKKGSSAEEMQATIIIHPADIFVNGRE
jgi:hypothetical protein